MPAACPKHVEAEDDDLPPRPPDGGWGWVVVIASLLCNVVVDGVCFSFGIFFEEFEKYYNIEKAKTAFIGSSLVGCYLLMGPITSALVNRFGCRKITIAGAVIAAVAFLLSTASPNINILIITYGIMGGIGFGMIYLPAIVIVGFYFEKRRAFATGISVCGSGIGMFIFAPLCRKLLEMYSWKGSAYILAGIILNVIVLGSLFRPLESPRRKNRKIIINRGNIMNKLIEEKRRQRTISTHSLDNTIITRDNKLITNPQIVQLINNMDAKINGTDKKGKTDITNLSASAGHLDSRNLVNPPQVVVEHVNGVSNGSQSYRTTIFNPGSTMSLQPHLLVNKRLQTVKELDAPTSHCYNNSNFSSSASVQDSSPSTSQFVSQDSMCDWTQSQISELEKLQRECEAEQKRRDLARPMYRKDIFYAGSVVELPQFKAVNNNVNEYIKSVTSIPTDTDTTTDSKVPFLTRHLPKPFLDVLRQMLDLSLLKSPTFLVLCVSSFLTLLGYFVPLVYINQKGKEVGIEMMQADLLISIIGISNTAGRVITGLIADRPWADVLLINNIALILAGAFTALCVSCETYFWLAGYCTVFGLCMSAFVSLRSILLVNLLGLDKLSNAFGLLILVQGVATVLGTPIAGKFVDVTGNLDMSFYAAGGIIALSGAMCFPLRVIKRWELRRMKGIKVDLFGDNNLDQNEKGKLYAAKGGDLYAPGEDDKDKMANNYTLLVSQKESAL